MKIVKYEILYNPTHTSNTRRRHHNPTCGRIVESATLALRNRAAGPAWRHTLHTRHNHQGQRQRVSSPRASGPILTQSTVTDSKIETAGSILVSDCVCRQRVSFPRASGPVLTQSTVADSKIETVGSILVSDCVCRRFCVCRC